MVKDQCIIFKNNNNFVVVIVSAIILVISDQDGCLRTYNRDLNFKGIPAFA
jgi:hypothetical protein